jgi:hypothetical protein
MAEDTIKFRMRWMNRSKYHKNGKLNIHQSKSKDTKREAMADFKKYTEWGYAIQIQQITVRMLEVFGGDGKVQKAAEFVLPTKVVIAENTLWKQRIRKDDIKNLKLRRDNLEASLTEVNENLHKLGAS